MPLPPLPGHRLRVVDETPVAETGYLWVRRLKLVATFEGGDESAPFAYDAIGRNNLDAVVVVPHYASSGERMVVLRSALRPPAFVRPMDARPVAELESLGNLWEVPAGLVEAYERTPEGLRGCAARELLEETGIEVAAERLSELGPATFPTPGMCGERHFFFHVDVTGAPQGHPPEDGSTLERHAKLAHLSLAEALDACRNGLVEDAKTELALRRLAECRFSS